ncbi:MAG: lipid II flippase MurJ [Candidatus Asgardarchaeia archaeon]
MLIIANLQPENYGIFSIASATYLVITSVLQSFFVLPFIRTISRYLGKKDFAAISYVYGLSTIVALISSIIIAIIHFEASPFIAVYILGYPEVIEYMKLLSINIVTSLIAALFRGFLLSLKSYRKLALSRLADGLFYIVGIYAMVLVYDWTVLAIVIGTDVYLLFSCLVTVFLAIAETRKRKIAFKVTFQKTLLKETFSLGKYFIVGNSLAYIFIRWDIFVVSIIVHDSLLIGYYSFAKNLVYRVRFLFTKVNALLYPVFSEQEASSDIHTMNKLLKAGNIISLVLSTPIAIFVAIFSKEGIILASVFIEKMYAYVNASNILAIFGLILIPYALDVAIIPYFNGIGEVDKLVKANSILLGSSLILLPVLSLYSNIIGAAIAYVTSQYLRTIYWVASAHKRVGINFKRYVNTLISSVLSIIIVKVSFDTLEQLLVGLDIIVHSHISFLIIPLLLIHSLITYIFLVRTKVITKREISILERGFGKNKLARKLIDFAEKIGRFKK